MSEKQVGFWRWLYEGIKDRIESIPPWKDLKEILESLGIAIEWIVPLLYLFITSLFFGLSLISEKPYDIRLAIPFPICILLSLHGWYLMSKDDC